MHGLASIYADKFSGKKTASGQRFSQKKLTAAHRSLPLGTKVRVINTRNHKSVEVRINDRGPWLAGRVIDLSAAAAAKIGMMKVGVQLVKLEIIRERPIQKT
jgi:rare lipoprotein A